MEVGSDSLSTQIGLLLVVAGLGAGIVALFFSLMMAGTSSIDIIFPVLILGGINLEIGGLALIQY